MGAKTPKTKLSGGRGGLGSVVGGFPILLAGRPPKKPIKGKGVGGGIGIVKPKDDTSIPPLEERLDYYEKNKDNNIVDNPLNAPGYGMRVDNPFGIYTFDFRDSDGDGVDDRDQRGPGQPKIKFGKEVNTGLNKEKEKAFSEKIEAISKEDTPKADGDSTFFTEDELKQGREDTPKASFPDGDSTFIKKDQEQERAGKFAEYLGMMADEKPKKGKRKSKSSFAGNKLMGKGLRF
tara:strand:- start:814 stop:1515 length:702 start_codon:yes stop_codon:yes gene_type:complete